MSKIREWQLDPNALSLNVDKTKCITFSMSPSAAPNIFFISISWLFYDFHCSVHIQRTDCVKYLELEPNSRVKTFEIVNNNIRKTIHKFMQLHFKNHFKIIYYTIVECINNYEILQLIAARKWIIEAVLNEPVCYSTESLFDRVN